MHSTVTREHKLALIVGFSLVLVLGVLLSDHLSTRNQNLRPPLATVQAGTPQDFGGENPLADTNPALAVAQPPPVTPQTVQPQTVQNQPSQRAPAGTIPPSPTDPLAGPRTPTTVASNNRPLEVLSPSTLRPPTDALANVRAEVLPPTNPGAADTAPQPVPNPGNLPVSSEPVRRHDLRENESVYAIASRYYGDGSLWTKLREYPGNAGKIGPKGEVRQGVMLHIPPRDVLLGKAVPADARPTQAATPSSTRDSTRDSGRADTRTNASSTQTPAQPAQAAKDTKTTTYTVREGDTLASIARRRLGSVGRVQEIIALNRALADDPDSLSVGDQIRLPAR